MVASVKFNEKLRDAVEINVLGTKKILDLVMGIKNLKVCRCHLCVIFECNRNVNSKSQLRAGTEQKKSHTTTITRIPKKKPNTHFGDTLAFQFVSVQLDSISYGELRFGKYVNRYGCEVVKKKPQNLGTLTYFLISKI